MTTSASSQRRVSHESITSRCRSSLVKSRDRLRVTASGCWVGKAASPWVRPVVWSAIAVARLAPSPECHRCRRHRAGSPRAVRSPICVSAHHVPGAVERDGFGELRDHLIVQQHHRRAASLGQIEGADGLAVDFVHRGRRQHNDRIVAMAAPARLHQVGLRRPGRHAGGRAAAHDIDDDARDFGASGVAEIFLLERKSRTAGRGHGFDAAHRGADHGRHRCDFVFHLHEYAADFGQLRANRSAISDDGVIG